MAKRGKKIILFLVEGMSDMVSLELIQKLNTSEDIKFQITRGDVTTKPGIKVQNCILKVNKNISDFLRDSKLKKQDIISITHILDTDGTYIPDENITAESSLAGFVYTTAGIKGPTIEAVSERNRSKKDVLEKLLNTSSIQGIPYKLYYMSCNLEHVLYDKLEIVSDDEKRSLSNEFADKFYGREREFIEFINNPIFKVEGDYKGTWDFIKQGLNSVNRYSNFHLFFEND